MSALPTAPQRAQRVRGVPGVGLRTADGMEWLRWGKGHRWYGPGQPYEAGWVIARCTHQTGEFVRLSADDPGYELGNRWDACGRCAVRFESFTVQSCTRPGKYGNPFVVAQNERGTYVVTLDGAVIEDGSSWGGTGSWWTPDPERNDAQVREHTKKLANASAIIGFANRVMCDWPDAMFHDLARFDYLSCFCPLDKPCHVDAIIAEGARRGIWGGG